MNHAQNKIVHSLLAKTGLMQQKATLVHSFSKGRTQSSRELSFDEATELIGYLKKVSPFGGEAKMRRKIISMAHEMGWHNLIEGRWVADMRHVNNWCVQFGYLKKELNKYTHDELPKLVSQFERVYKSHLMKI